MKNLEPEKRDREIHKLEQGDEDTEDGDRLGGKELEADGMWSDVRAEKNPRWLWHALARGTGKVLADVFGRRKDEIFQKLKKLLERLGIPKYGRDGWGAYSRHLPSPKPEIATRKTRNIERKH